MMTMIAGNTRILETNIHVIVINAMIIGAHQALCLQDLTWFYYQC